ncbi:MAG: IS1634 family transposase [Nitriliruptor sp.]
MAETLGIESAEVWASVYLRTTSKKNRDGSTSRYLALAHNFRDPDTGTVKAQVLHNFGRAEHVERDALERLIASIARYLDIDPPVAGDGDGDVEPIDGRDLGGAWVLDQLWDRLQIGAEVRKLARKANKGRGRKVDVDQLERVLFALVAGRALAPSSKLEATRWIREEVHIDGLAEMDHTACYRVMDWLLDHLEDLQQTVFFAVADLLQLDVDMIFFDTTSTYFEIEFEDGELEGADDGFRARGHSKDSRPDLPQVVIGMAVTRTGMPVRLWVWPGDTADTTVMEQVKADLVGWKLNRTVWVVDAGFASKDNRKTLTAGGSGFIVAERLRGKDAQVAEARARQGRFKTVDGQLQVKEIRVGEGAATQRFIMCRNLQAAERDAAIRDRLVALLADRITGTDALDPDARAELRGRIREKPGLWRYLRVTKSGLLRIDRAKIAAEAKLDGKYLLRTSDLTLSAEDVARGYKALLEVERGWRDLKQLDLRPVYHRLEHRIVAHVQLSWLALLLIRTAEIAVGDTWRNIAHELDRLQLITFETDGGTVSQRTRLTAKQHAILAALDLPEPPRYYQFEPTGD